jgi:hypothetical protein
MYIYPLSRIHNTSLTSANIGLDTRECDCLESRIKLHDVRLTTRLDIHLQFNISANALEIRAIKSPKCIV